ncbi:MAG: DUF1972 domain-containing protein [Bacteroidetes bacterium]|nr:glycosyltransferase family 1 protein [Bacteroidota bacterium]NOG56453.1 DUF1972 domain-containing protein [Bacteroidota bacterium]
MKIGILGTRGVPNHYGGFEQFASYLSKYLASEGHEVFVYNSSLHPYQEKTWEGVNLIHSKDLEDKIGTAGQFVYDLNCILDARKRNFDILLQLGYTSSSVWAFLLPKKATIVTNMDGLEWKRTKFSRKVQGFLKMAEKWAVKSSDVLVADSIGIQSYLKEKYQVDSTYIAYGADVFEQPNQSVLDEFKLQKNQYFLLIARMEPENNVETILDGFNLSNSEWPFIVVGKTENEFSSHLIEKYKNNTKICFVGGIYDIEKLNNLRHYSSLYFHGHSVGGTNPSLLEAMASNTCIVAHNNIFNKAILGEDAFYFENATQVKERIEKPVSENSDHSMRLNNKQKIRNDFTWEKIVKAYEDLFTNLAP